MGARKKRSLSEDSEGLTEILPTKAPNKKKKQNDEPPQEKRLRRWRKSAPESYLQIYSRAITQRMFVLDRVRGGTADCPEETVELAGTTGNIYTVRIEKKPSCTCPHAIKGNQCKHIVYVMARVLRAPASLRYQLAFVSSELRGIFEKAPPVPSADSNATDNRRKKVEDTCPICCDDMEDGTEDIVWCKAACGNNIHKVCFMHWAATKKGSVVTCPFCRTPWQSEDDETLKNISKGNQLNAEGYINVADQLNLSGERDYSTYHQPWVRRQRRLGNL